MPLLCLEKYCWIKNFQAQGRYFIWRFSVKESKLSQKREIDTKTRLTL